MRSLQMITRILSIAVLSAALVFALGACKGGNDGGDSGDPVVIYTWAGLDSADNTGAKFDLREDKNNYPGREIVLAECPSISGTIGDISEYSRVTIWAICYSTVTSGTGSSAVGGTKMTNAEGNAHFSILGKGTSGWSDSNKQVVGWNLQTYDSTTEAPVTPVATPGTDSQNQSKMKSGTPGKLLVQGSYERAGGTSGTPPVTESGKVNLVEVKMLKFEK